MLAPLSFFVLTTSTCFSQKINGKLKFEQGQILHITTQLKTSISQQAGGQVIDFSLDASGEQAYKVTNATADNSTLHHQLQRIIFSFDGMGRKMDFDSKNEKDMNGMFGKPIMERLDKNYNIIIDSGGKVLMTLPEKIQLTETDSRMAIINSLLKDIIDLVHPPQKDKASFFKVLPDNEVGKGDAWTISSQTDNGKIDAAYAIADINDTTVVIDFAANSVTVTKAEMMGSETTTTMNNKSTGKIILDRLTGLIREKTVNTESAGNTESSFGNLPVTSKTSLNIKVSYTQQ
ncbi:MAG: DUF6263 family protein [Bacteroidota bacterium]